MEDNATVMIEEANGHITKGELYSNKTKAKKVTNRNGAARFNTAIGHYNITIMKNNKVLAKDDFYKPEIIKGLTIYLNGTNKGTLD